MNINSKNKNNVILMDLLKALQKYSLFMDTYFCEHDIDDSNREIYNAYKEYSNDLIEILYKVGAIKK